MKIEKVYGLNPDDLPDESVLIEIAKGFAEAQGELWELMTDSEQQRALADVITAIRGRLQ